MFKVQLVYMLPLKKDLTNIPERTGYAIDGRSPSAMQQKNPAAIAARFQFI